MKLLVLGGTIFLGRLIVAEALLRGHEVTLFNRGKHNADLFPQVEHLRGDRYGDLAALQGRSWDAVVDTCGSFPRLVRLTGELLKDAVSHYTFISSCSAYAEDGLPAVIREDAPLATMPLELVEEVTEKRDVFSYYGALKVLSEQTLEEIMPGRVLNVRAGLLVGPHDYSDRFTYWPNRVARGGEVLAPAPKFPQVSLLDARDLAAWVIHMIEANQTGVYNATGNTYSLPELIEECKRVTNSDATFAWVSDDFLQEQAVEAWMELPLWVPGEQEPFRFFRMNQDKGLADGLHIRPLAETIRDTWLWDQTRPSDQPRKAGLDPEREKELLQAWWTVKKRQ